MKGDFSRWRTGSNRNFNGVLPQQGKVLLDSDGVAQTMLANEWQQTEARDVIGACAAVPQSAPNSFQISAATLSAAGDVKLTVGTGHIWADGLLVRLSDAANDPSVPRAATWLEPPIVLNEGSAADVAEGTVDTIVLEVWQRAVNGFSMPDALIEPALGGPDTAERLQTECAFRLARLTAGQSCNNLTYDESSSGTLLASLVPTVTISGDCPLDATGGYSGFEHQLYRIEIADTNAAFKEFKWSRVNAGLVGRGTFDPVGQALTIDANLAAINSYNQTAFYLEIEQYDPSRGYTVVLAGASATLNAGVLQLSAAPHFGAYPTTAGDVFFRLWDGIAALTAYPIVTLPATPTVLENGIQLQFTPEATTTYLPGDYWMFPVRAQGIANPQVLIDTRQPHGIRYHRVPLAEITWTSDGAGGWLAASIEDCREPIFPVTQPQCCCTHRVGDGLNSFAEFTSIQAAIDALPQTGGEICILPGRYFENVLIYQRANVVIRGCGWQTRVASASLAPNWNATPVPLWGVQQQDSGIAAVFTVIGSEHIQFSSLAVEAASDEAGILLDGEDLEVVGQASPSMQERARVSDSAHEGYFSHIFDIVIENLIMTGAQYPAILGLSTANLAVRDNRIVMSDETSNWPAVSVSGTTMHIERNIITLAGAKQSLLPTTVLEEVTLKVSGADSHQHPGGLQIGGPSSGVYVRCNEILQGNRNGITLGSLKALDANQQSTGGWNGVVTGVNNICTGSLTVQTGGTGTTGGTITYVNAGLLSDITIEGNTISMMGLCGIGPVAYFDLAQEFETISIERLSIVGNTILDTVRRSVDQANAAVLSGLMGMGAITVPDVMDLVIRDNTITNFGEKPGVRVSGIFILLCEDLEIERNRIVETRDWPDISEETSAGQELSGGIVIFFVTPPAIDSDSVLASMYEPGMPAAHISKNTVRVPLGQALLLLGIGPIAIENNQFASGGMVRNGSTQIAQTVLIANLGAPIERSTTASYQPKDMYMDIQSGYYKQQISPSSDFSDVTNGTVLFANNICQLEARLSGQTELASVVIFTPDTLVFSNNITWLDADSFSAWTDILLMGFTVQVIGNRFQEALGSVLVSGLTIGAFNITTQNIATACLLAFPATSVTTGNLVMIDAGGEGLCHKAFSTLAVANT